MSIKPYRSNLLRDKRFDDFYSMIDSFFNDSFTPQTALSSSTFKVDISENDKEYKVEAELPGFSKDEIEVNFEEGKLIISARKNEEENIEEKNYIHRERKTSEMTRRMFFKDVDEENLSAQLDGGVLEITIPKKENLNKSKKIEIK